MPPSTLGFRVLATLLHTYNSIRYGKDSMEALFGQAMKDSATLRKSGVPWKDDEPHAQSYYTFDSATSAWVAKTPSEETAGNGGIDDIALYSWNIDFMLPFAEARMKPALAYLGSLVGSNPTNTAPVIFLQECTPSDLAIIAATPWIRERFHLTDLDATNWATNHYGTVTLIDSRLPITAAFRVHYSKTRMDRDAFFVDVSVEGKTVRLCNTHLESMVFNPPFRPPQMQLVAQYLHEEKVHAGLAAGDFNAIQPFDRTLHTDNGLKDAFLELGGKEDTDEGYTWGQQAATKLREKFGCSRMDKVYFCGGADVVKFERFGEDVLTDGEDESNQIVALGFEKAWVTDHLGIKAEVKILGDKSTSRL
ncbi:Endo/exonuclease/phosphatase domain-containing protein [Fusarium falciforme]|uniref:Endo/exonuclease/phosphatase domain-containing protein n=1 Tax=Fusarium falciforme TaxID=195108 RepID=UPI0022FFDC5E|nr:Endo/exonuclease/phosphatase domain-containing protein [Fusarium falciforme]WAO95478.1 Endo/exonuclease/phosphatase domain-containing protein [Fusarium falciforme]